jgi:hypothetical protein
MTAERLNLTLEIEPKKVGKKEVNLRASLLVSNLIAEIQDRFSLDGTLALERQGGEEQLDASSRLDEVGVSDGEVLVCRQVQSETGTQAAIARGVREPLPEGYKRVYLEEERTRTEYELAWQPAIIGRWDHRDPSMNRLLAADLEGLEELPTVSRHHACITVEDNKFFIEQLAARNPTYLDGTKLNAGRKYPLEPGDNIQVGRISLTFNALS